jgi:hypothetical protein
VKGFAGQATLGVTHAGQRALCAAAEQQQHVLHARRVMVTTLRVTSGTGLKVS